MTYRYIVRRHTGYSSLGFETKKKSSERYDFVRITENHVTISVSYRTQTTVLVFQICIHVFFRSEIVKQFQLTKRTAEESFKTAIHNNNKY